MRWRSRPRLRRRPTSGASRFTSLSASQGLKRLAGPSRLLFGDLGFAWHGHDPQRSDAVAFAPQYTKTEAMEGKALTAFGDRARLMDDKSGDRGGFLVGKMPVHGAVEI